MPNYKQLAEDNEKFSKYCKEHGITPGVSKISPEAFDMLVEMLYPDEPDASDGRAGSESTDDEQR